jgi:signal transduction histidine kinase
MSPFYWTERVLSTYGRRISGIDDMLRLFISKSIIEAHGGTISAGNNEDGKRGATFTFTLPLSK